MPATAPVQRPRTRFHLAPVVRRVWAAVQRRLQRARDAASWQIRPKPCAVIIGNTPVAIRVAACLNRCGMECQVTGSTAELIASALQPDIVMADLVLTGANPIDSIRELRSSLPNSTVCFYCSSLLGNPKADYHLALGKAVLQLAGSHVSRDRVYLLLRGGK